jgi:hypothetical protein
MVASLASALGGAQTGWAQTIIGAAAQPVQAKLQAFTSALSLFAAGNPSAGEAVLEQANTQQEGTPSWDKESGFELIKVAHYFENTANPALAYSIAKLALGHLIKADQAYTSAAAASEIANEKELQGQLYEHYFSDRATAEKYYAAAVALSPNTGLAPASLLRLQQLDGAQAAKVAYAAGGQ